MDKNNGDKMVYDFLKGGDAPTWEQVDLAI